MIITMKKLILSFALLGAISTHVAAQDVIPASEAFKVSHIVSSDKLMVNFRVADGYQLYKESIKLSDNVTGVLTDMPEGRQATDEFKGDVTYYDGSFQVTGELNNVKGNTFYIEYQGCLPDVFCYPPQKHEIILP